jgi:hypothetical protein
MEEYGMRWFENKVLRNIAGGITGGRRKVHNKELHDFYSLSNAIIPYQGK